LEEASRFAEKSLFRKAKPAQLNTPFTSHLRTYPRSGPSNIRNVEFVPLEIRINNTVSLSCSGAGSLPYNVRIFAARSKAAFLSGNPVLFDMANKRQK